jgi:hypothetical protein
MYKATRKQLVFRVFCASLPHKREVRQEAGMI